MTRKRLNDTFGFTDIYNDGLSIIRVNTQLRFGTFQLVEAQYNFTLQPWAHGGSDPNCLVAELPDEYKAVRRAEGVLLSNTGTLCVVCIGLTDNNHIEIRTLGEQLAAHVSVRAQLIWYF